MPRQTTPEAAEYRRKRELMEASQEELASALGLHRRTVGGRERGTVRITEEAKIALDTLVKRKLGIQ